MRTVASSTKPVPEKVSVIVPVVLFTHFGLSVSTGAARAQGAGPITSVATATATIVISRASVERLIRSSPPCLRRPAGGGLARRGFSRTPAPPDRRRRYLRPFRAPAPAAAT